MAKMSNYKAVIEVYFAADSPKAASDMSQIIIDKWNNEIHPDKTSALVATVNIPSP